MKIKIVVQRYGEELLGGAERHAALVAGLLSRHHEVEVLTTTAGDYQTWSSAYPTGEARVDRISVRRFAVVRGRHPGWQEVTDDLHEGFEPRDFARLPAAERGRIMARIRAWPLARQEDFIRAQGPIVPELISYLAHRDFDRVLFVTYLYPTTYDGLAAVAPARAYVIPTLHDEPPAYLPAFGRRLASATLLCSTEAEIDLVHRLYPDRRPQTHLLGYGLDLPPDRPAARQNESPFLLCAGRIDSQKGMEELCDWYATLVRAEPRAPRLILIGKSDMSLPELPGLEVRGFVSDEEKVDLMRRALALVHPSPFESLGIVLLEALAVRTPVVVNGRCDVLVEHCRRGQCGLWVRDGAEFAAAVNKLRDTPGLRDALGASGRHYVETNYGLESYERNLLGVFPANVD